MMDPAIQYLLSKIARAHQGDHYLWGGYGATPDSQDGAPCRPGAINLIKPVKLESSGPRVFSAYCTIDGGSICAGRSKLANSMG